MPSFTAPDLSRESIRSTGIKMRTGAGAAQHAVYYGCSHALMSPDIEVYLYFHLVHNP